MNYPIDQSKLSQEILGAEDLEIILLSGLPPSLKGTWSYSMKTELATTIQVTHHRPCLSVAGGDVTSPPATHSSGQGVAGGER